MTNNKKSVLLPERLAQLKQPGATYIISCYDDEYFCLNHSEGCWRGFFSLYLQAIHGIQFATRIGLPYHVDFGNLTYRYSDEKNFNGDRNLWSYYFEQDSLGESNLKILNVRNENYPLRVWSRAFIRKLHEQAVTKLVLKADIQNSIDQMETQFKGLNILGIHIRRSDHFHEVKHASLSSYFKTVNRMINSFDKIFVATDDESILQDFILKYPEKVLQIQACRSSGTLAVHANMKTENRYQLGKEALLECYSLAMCNRVILSPSNLSYAALMINPTLEYELIESWAARFKRWKTLIVFYLDQWKIRKW